MSDEAKNPSEAEELDYEPDIIELEDENGSTHTFEILDVADVGDTRYFAVVPYDADPAKRLQENAEMLIMRVGTDENGDEYLDVVDDDEELYEVGQVFYKRLSEVYNIDLEELEKEMKEEERRKDKEN